MSSKQIHKSTCQSLKELVSNLEANPQLDCFDEISKVLQILSAQKLQKEKIRDSRSRKYSPYVEDLSSLKGQLFVCPPTHSSRAKYLMVVSHTKKMVRVHSIPSKVIRKESGDQFFPCPERILAYSETPEKFTRSFRALPYQSRTGSPVVLFRGEYYIPRDQEQEFDSRINF